MLSDWQATTEASRNTTVGVELTEKMLEVCSEY